MRHSQGYNWTFYSNFHYHSSLKNRTSAFVISKNLLFWLGNCLDSRNLLPQMCGKLGQSKLPVIPKLYSRNREDASLLLKAGSPEILLQSACSRAGNSGRAQQHKLRSDAWVWASSGKRMTDENCRCSRLELCTVRLWVSHCRYRTGCLICQKWNSLLHNFLTSKMKGLYCWLDTDHQAVVFSAPVFLLLSVFLLVDSPDPVPHDGVKAVQQPLFISEFCLPLLEWGCAKDLSCSSLSVLFSPVVFLKLWQHYSGKLCKAKITRSHFFVPWITVAICEDAVFSVLFFMIEVTTDP